MELKLLIVDDSHLMRSRIASQAMGCAGVRIVGEAADGERALELFSDLEPDFVILDLHMPGMGGIEVLKAIRQRSSRARVCVLTNYDYPQYRRRCIDYGAQYFLSKSGDFGRLPSIVAHEAAAAGLD